MASRHGSDVSRKSSVGVAGANTGARAGKTRATTIVSTARATGQTSSRADADTSVAGSKSTAAAAVAADGAAAPSSMAPAAVVARVSSRTAAGRNQPGMSSSDSMQGSGSMQGQNGHKAGKSQVRQVQEALKAQGHDPGPIDGVMGPQQSPHQSVARDHRLLGS